MLNETQGQKSDSVEMKTYSDLRAEDIVRKQKRTEFRTQIYDSYVYIDEIKKSDEVFLFQTKMEL